MSKSIRYPQRIINRAKELGKARFAFGVFNARVTGEMFSFIDEENSDKLWVFMSAMANDKTPQEAFAEAWGK